MTTPDKSYLLQIAEDAQALLLELGNQLGVLTDIRTSVEALKCPFNQVRELDDLVYELFKVNESFDYQKGSYEYQSQLRAIEDALSWLLAHLDALRDDTCEVEEKFAEEYVDSLVESETDVFLEEVEVEEELSW